MAPATNAERGSVIVETCISMMLIMSLIAGLLSGFYVGFVRVWVKYSSYEAAVCLARGETEYRCKDDLETRINNLLIGRPLENVQMRKTRKLARVEFDVRLPGNLVSSELRSLKLPLRESRSFQ